MPNKKNLPLTEGKIRKILYNNNDILKKYKVKRIGLFGSYVRHAQKRQSDIDFLVELKEPSFDNFMELVFSLEELFGKKVDIITHNSLSPYIRPHVEQEVKWHEV